MKNNIIKVVIIIAILTNINCYTVYADNLKEETIVSESTKTSDTNLDVVVYKERTNIIKADIKAINKEIKELKESTKEIMKKYDDMIYKYKNDRILTISEENYNKVSELIKTIPTKEKEEASLDSETSVQTYEKNNDYNAALNKLYANYNKKQNELAYIKAVNNIWKQIDILIN